MKKLRRIRVKRVGVRLKFGNKAEYEHLVGTGQILRS